MSDTNSTGFGKFVPGFDFLQNLAKGAGAGIPQMPNLGAWVAPSLSVEDLDKRIEELKNVLFWLEQNSRALSATIQALEVQKLTLATLKGMNFNIAEMANSLRPKPAAMPAEAEPEPEPEEAPDAGPDDADGKATDEAAPLKPMIDPLQLWGSLTQQFQTIAASALKEATAAAAKASAKAPSKAASKASTKSTAKAPPKAPAKKAAAKKPAAKRAPAKRAAPAKAAARKPAGR